MHKFNIEIRGRKLVTTDPSKQDFLDRLIDDYERRKIVVQIALSIPEKDITTEQESVYRAFILKAADHFGTDYNDMRKTLWALHPRDPDTVEIKDLSKWTTKELNFFIDKASSHLAQFGFHF